MMPGINDGTRDMAMVETRAHEIADGARTMKRSLIRLVSRDGEIDEEEMALVRAFDEHQHELEEKAEDEVFGIAMFRRGRGSDRVVRLGRQLFTPEFDPAA
jgi:hypothetical protein